MASSAFISSPSRNKTTSSRHSSSSAFASSSSSFAPRSSPFYDRRSSSSSPSSAASSSSSSVRFSIDRPISPRRSMSVTKQSNNVVSSNKRMCMCAPTTHPGSFRCSYHKRLAQQHQNQTASSSASSFHQSSGMSLNLRRSAMKNSLVRIGGVEGELVKRTLTSLIRPSSHHQRRREAFQPRPSRLANMSNAEAL